MIPVYIAGVGMTHFGKSPSTLVELLREAALGAVSNSAIQEIDAIYVALMNSEEFTGESNLASHVAEVLGVPGIPAIRVETATSAGAAAFHAGFQGIASGYYRHVLVIGGEKMTHLSTSETTRILAEVLDAQERECGATMPALAAMVTESYRRQYHLSQARIERMLCRVAMKNHFNGSQNPYAQFRRVISESDYLSSKIISTPLRLYDCAPISDGAAATVLTAERTDVVVSGIGQGTGPVSLSVRPSLTCFPATQIAAKRAYEMAALAPRDIDFAEVHDAFTSFELISAEDLGFFSPGKAGHAVEAGMTSLDGELPVNPSGGLKARGHPAGASGTAQIVEAVKILRRQSPFKLTREPRRALTHSIGGLATNNFVTIVERTQARRAARHRVRKNAAAESPHFRPSRRKRMPRGIAAEGKIETFTISYVTPDRFVPPLGLALVRDKKGSRVMAQAEDVTQLKIGRAVYLRKSAATYYCSARSHPQPEVKRLPRELKGGN
jgi:acetyl-CoA C-acetyltransferase